MLMFFSNCLRDYLSFYNPFQRPSESLNLTEVIKEKTDAIHQIVERHLFVKRLLRQDLSEKEYQQHLTDLKVVYKTLEKKISLHKDKNFIKSIYFEKLFRAEEITKDLNHPSYFKYACQPSEAALNYKCHLKEISNSNPILLIAHAYIRYLGDLSGGLIVKGAVEKKWEGATSFYEFEDLLIDSHCSKVAEFKEIFKKGVNDLSLSKEEISNISEEALKVFQLSAKLFDAIVPGNEPML